VLQPDFWGLNRLRLSVGADAIALSEQISDAWLAFAKSGNPSTTALPWPAYDPVKRRTMLFDRASHVAEDPGKAERLLLGRIMAPIHA